MAPSDDVCTLALPKFQGLPTTPTSTMPQSPYPRNTYVYDANVPQGLQPILVAGFMQLGHTTGEEFYFYLEICFAQPLPGQFRLLDSNGNVLPRDSTVVPLGAYAVIVPGCSTWFSL